MRISLDRLRDAISCISDEESVRTLLAQATRDLGFDGYAFLAFEANWTFAVSDYHEEWQSRYFARHYSTLDPVVTHAKSRLKSFVWWSERELKSATDDGKRLLKEAIDFGIRWGITIPVRTGYGHASMLTLSSRRPSVSGEPEIDAVAAAAIVGELQGRVEALKAEATGESFFYLKPKEILYLKWIAEGKSMQEVADMHRVKYNSVKINLESAKQRCGATNITQLVALAIRRGMI